MNFKKIDKKSWSLAILSGILLIMSFPPFDVEFLAWVAFVPLLVAIHKEESKRVYWLASIFCLTWFLPMHITWYCTIFPVWLALLLSCGLALLYAELLLVDSKMRNWFPNLQVITLPILWTSFDFLRMNLPITKDWWLIILANSQWKDIPILQLMTITGVYGITFFILLVNSAIAYTIINYKNETFKRISRQTIVVGLIFVAIFAFGWLSVPQASKDISIVAIQDNHDNYPDEPGSYAVCEITESATRNQFDVQEELTKKSLQYKPDFIVWSESVFVYLDDAAYMDKIGDLARSMDSYIMANVVERIGNKKYNTAILFSPEGGIVAKYHKHHITWGEKACGFVAEQEDGFPVVETKKGKVGLEICYDRHFSDVTRNLAKNDAQLILIPVDDSNYGSYVFPQLHASDAIFRAVENRVSIGLAAITGISLITDPYGRVIGSSGVYTQEIIAGKTFVVTEKTFYTRYGDVFSYLVVVLAFGLVTAFIYSSALRKIKMR